ncbi:MAG: hypothetical protein DSZ12_07145 [Sulfurovum sp.]|nr:MAG: hypothetical protein DSZ12_07145 [Sulfurovum sp.]
MNRFKYTLFFPLTLLLISCGGNKGKSLTTSNHTIDISDTIQIESLGMAQKIHAKVTLGDSPKDLYVLLSNYAHTDGSVKIATSNKKVEKLYKQENVAMREQNKIHAPANVEYFRNNISYYLKEKSHSSSAPKYKKIHTDKNNKVHINDKQTFFLDTNDVTKTIATLKKSVLVSTDFGAKTLNVWVSDDSFGKGCHKVRCVTQTMVDALADAFLKKGKDNDVYDWVTNVYGQEWGSHSYTRLISPNNEISILLTDIGNDNSTTRGAIGYFYSKDNFKKSEISGSNEKIMFYLDAVFFANSKGSWSINGFWAKETVSTLAHEFQHMIHFYQKTLLLAHGEQTDVWINEMLSETTEDLVASKIKHSGPRGVPYTIGSAGEKGNTKGRYPLFNYNNRSSLTTWNSEVVNYSVVNAFGTFLTRNYGGAKILHDIMYNAHVDEDAVVSAIRQTAKGTDKTFNTLLKEWGVAVLLSDNDHLDESLPHYNTGGYMPNQYRNSVYQLGSIDFFNYSPQPRIFGSSGTVENQGNYYYKVGSKLTGTIDLDLELNGQTEATLIAK